LPFGHTTLRVTDTTRRHRPRYAERRAGKKQNYVTVQHTSQFRLYVAPLKHLILAKPKAESTRIRRKNGLTSNFG